MKKSSFILSFLSICILCNVSSCQKENFNDFKTNQTSAKKIAVPDIEVVQNSIILDTPYKGNANPTGLADTPYNGRVNVVALLDTPYNTTVSTQIIVDTPYNKP